MRGLDMLRSLFLLLALLAVLLVPPVIADDEEGDEEEEATEFGVDRATDEQAKELVAAMEKVVKETRASKVMEVLDELAGYYHEDFQKPLIKFLGHKSAKVAMEAADLLSDQRCEKERAQIKFAKDVWKSGWANRVNEKRYLVRTRVLIAVATIEGNKPLDDRRIKEVMKLWKTIRLNPAENLAPALVDICEYVAATGDKRLCRLLAEEIDDPTQAEIDVDSPSNPPQTWWEARWKLWNGAHAAAVEALEELTGQSFKTTTRAKAWFALNEREFGFEW